MRSVKSLLLLAAAARHDRLDSDGRRAAEIAADAIAARWQEPDAGIWEIDDQPWTHSRLTCAAGLRASGQIMRLAGPGRRLGRTRRCHHRRIRPACACIPPALAAFPGDDGLDAALLLPAIRGALPADDPRTVETLRAYMLS